MSSDSHIAEPPKRKRRWFQFSLRSLLIFVLLCAIPCAWFGVRMRRAAAQREAIEAIEGSGGWVRYDYECDFDGSFVGGKEPPGPAFLRNLLGEDFFAGVRVARVTSDAGLSHLEGLPQLERFALESGSVTDAGLVNIKNSMGLRTLIISAAKITDEGITQLGGLTQLQELYLNGTKVTDAGVARLAHALPNCKVTH